MREIAQNRLYRIGYRKNNTIKGRTLSQEILFCSNGDMQNSVKVCMIMYVSMYEE